MFEVSAKPGVTIVTPSLVCTDSDGGQVSLTKGKVVISVTSTGGTYVYEDFCKDGNTISEYYCLTANPDTYLSGPQNFYGVTNINCPYGCSNGACLAAAPVNVTPTPTPTPTCTDSDGGNNIYVKGEYTSSDKSKINVTDFCWAYTGHLGEYYCDSSGEGIIEVTCQYGCIDGACMIAVPVNETTSVVNVTPSANTPVVIPAQENESIIYSCQGCEISTKCYPFGYRKAGKYCSEESIFVKQLDGKAVCENNFECITNLCVSDQCVTPTFIERFLNWLRRLFG